MLDEPPTQEYEPGRSWEPRYAYVHQDDVVATLDTWADGCPVVYEQALTG